jgi:hypothetical protein
MEAEDESKHVEIGDTAAVEEAADGEEDDPELEALKKKVKQMQEEAEGKEEKEKKKKKKKKREKKCSRLFCSS